MKFKELAKEWLYINHRDEIKPRTLLRYECCLNQHLYPHFQDEEIDNLTPRDMQRWIQILKEDVSNRTKKILSPSSINTFIAILKMIFGYAYDFEIILNNPTARIRRMPSKEEKRVKAFTREEQIRIENYIEKQNNNEYFPYILVLYTGIRLGELLALTWKDINLKTGTMTISKTLYKYPTTNGKWEYRIDSPKSIKSNREIPLPMFLREKLAVMKKEKKSQHVVSRNDGTSINDKTLIYRYHMILKRTKTRYLNFHCLRHTFATRALENNIDIKTLSELLGHANAATTLNIYTHSLMKHKRQQIKKMKRLI